MADDSVVGFSITFFAVVNWRKKETPHQRTGEGSDFVS
jgi:hypothetical protein